MSNTTHRQLSAFPYRRAMRRHPNFFMTLMSFIFLGALSVFLLIMTSVTQDESQDIRQKAADDAFDSATTTLPNLNPPICSAPTIPPATGAIPLSVTLHGGGTTGSGVGLKGYRWDFDGDGTWETGVSIEPIVHVYQTAGVFQPKYQVQNNNDVFSAICLYPYAVTATAPAANNPAADNLYFTTANKLEFFKESNNQSIKITDILAGERYRVRQTARIQNTAKNSNSTNASSVTLQFRANDSGVSTKNFAMSQLEKANDGIDIIFETSFVGRTDNSFTTTLDTANTVAESAENDNTLLTTYVYEVTTSPTATVSAATIASICNKYCANDGECNFGLKCWYNQCRHPDNVESDRCAPTASVVTGCNISCQTTRDCAAGLACSSNKCRNPIAISSDTCQVAPVSSVTTTKKSEKTTTTGQKGSTIISGSLQMPTPTVAPTALPSVRPSATPIPTPDSADRTVLSDFLGWFGQLPTAMQNMFGGGGTGSNLWFWLIGGVVLIIVLTLLSLLTRRGRRSLPPVPPPKPINHTALGHPPITAVRSPHAPTLPPAGAFQTSLSKQQNPGLSLANATTSSAQFYPQQGMLVQPTQPSPTTSANTTGFTAATTVGATPVGTTPAPANSSSTMLSRLQERGVIKPPATSTTTNTSGFPSQPTA